MNFLQQVKKLHRGKPTLSVVQSDVEDWGLINVVLRPHQLEGIKWLIETYQTRHGCILGDEMGLGKTLQSIGLILYLIAVEKLKGPILVLSPLSVTSGWESEFLRGSPHLKIINYCSGKEDRQQIQQEIQEHVRTKNGNMRSGPFPFNVILAHYEVALKDTSFLKKIDWGCLIVDEGHRLKNHESLLYQTLLSFDIKHTVLLTGTPVQNNLKELYSLLSFASPKTFPLNKLEKFVTDFATISDDSDLSSTLHSILEPFILRRTKAEVTLDIPMKSEVILYTGLSAVQRKVYKGILTKDLSVFGSEGNRTSLINVLINLRKCVNHPYLFDGIEPEPFEIGEHLIQASGKLFLFDKLLELLKSK